MKLINNASVTTSERDAMKNTAVKVLVIASVLSPTAAFARPAAVGSDEEGRGQRLADRPSSLLTALIIFPTSSCSRSKRARIMISA